MDQDQSAFTSSGRHVPAQIRRQVRFLMQDGSEHSGLVSEISVGVMNIISSAQPPEGSIVIAYVEEFGRLEGIVATVDASGIAVRLTLSANRREKIGRAHV